MFGAGRGLVVAELTHHQVLELYAMREILEGSAARFAAQHATEAEVAIINRLQRDLRQVKTDPLAIVRLNRQFHQAIYHAAHNQYLVQALESLNDSLALLNHTTFRMPKRRESDEEHTQDRARDREARPRRGRAGGARAHPQRAADAVQPRARRSAARAGAGVAAARSPHERSDMRDGGPALR